MHNKRDIQQELNTLRGLGDIIGAYEEIAAMRMRKVKKSVLQNRYFVQGLNDIYFRVLYTYEKYLKKRKGRKGAKEEKLQTNGKTVSVLITANTGLYGDIVRKTYDLFINNTEEANTDLVIIGRVGRQLYESRKRPKKYEYFEISDSGVDSQNTKMILEAILVYTNIVVYHGQFVSVLDQEAVRTYVTGKALDAKQASEAELQELKCIIEPSMEEVASFFEKQILSSIFEHSVYESSLSKFASRMITLDIASENISELIKKTDFKMLKLKHRDASTKQSERLAGITLWSN